MIIGNNESSVGQYGEPRIEASLRGLALTSPDVARLSHFYEDALGYSGAVDNGAWNGALAARRLAIGHGAANAIDHAVFAVRDEAQLTALGERLGAAGVPFDRVGSPMVDGPGIGFVDPDGNRLIFGVAGPGEADAPGALPARLQHVVYASDQVACMLDFYRDIVGFEPTDFVRDAERDVTSVFLRCGAEHHSLAVFRASRRRLDHFCYDVDDWSQIRDWADRFAERHVPLRWGPGRHGPGNNLFLFVNDPDGNWLEFSAELERIGSPRAAGEWAHEERTLNSWGSAILRS